MAFREEVMVHMHAHLTHSRWQLVEMMPCSCPKPIRILL